MKMYVVERSIDAFLVYPEGDPVQARLFERIDELLEFVNESGDGIYFGMTEGALRLWEDTW